MLSADLKDDVTAVEIDFCVQHQAASFIHIGQKEKCLFVLWFSCSDNFMTIHGTIVGREI
jgi:hypothetical protein